MKKYLFIVLILLSLLSSYAQKLQYSVKFSYSQPYIADVEQTLNYSPISATSGYTNVITSPGLKETYSSKSGGKLNGNLSYSINSRLFIEGGIQLNLVRYQQKTELSSDTYELFSGLGGDIVFAAGEPFGIITADPYWDLEYTNSRGDALANSDKLGNTSTLYT